MAGRHLRRSRGQVARAALLGAATFASGALLGAGTVAVDELGRRDHAVAGAAPVTVAVGGSSGGPSGPTGSARLEPEPGPITLAFVGDINVERVLAERLAVAPDDFVGPFADVLRDADLVVGNLEAALTDDVPGLQPAAKEFVFRAPPAVLDALLAGGIDVVSVANNHGVDLGPAGLEQTVAVARGRADGMVIGVGADEDEAYRPFVRDVGGHRVAVIAATQVLDADLISAWTAQEDRPGLASAKRVDRLVEEVVAADAGADVVVVFLHWGVEGEECPSAGQQELARALADAGADVIVGTHAHRVQGAGRLGDAVVHYGLGNFLFGAVSAASARTGVFTVEVDADGAGDYRWMPGRIEGSVPHPLAGDEAAGESGAWEAQRGCTGLAP